MQDYAKVLEGESAEKVGFYYVSQLDLLLSVQSNTVDAAASVKKGVPAGLDNRGERPNSQGQQMRTIGCGVDEGAPENSSISST